jgi:hypothetical protein
LRRSGAGSILVVALVVAASLTTRLWWEITAGVFVLKEYDDGVYYRAAVLLQEGGALYRDQVFVHPPGLPLLLLPTAWLGEGVGDSWGFVLARALLVVVSTAVAVGLTLHIRRIAGLAGGLASGLLYAVHPCVVVAGDTVLMEPFIDAATLVAVVVLTVPGMRRAVVAGVALGLAGSVKLWAAVPAAVLAVLLLVERRVTQAVALAGGAVVASAIVLALAVRAPAAAWEQIVLTQLGREPDGVLGLGPRLTFLSGTWSLPRPWGVFVVLAGATASVAVAVVMLRKGPRVLLAWPVLAAVWGVLLLVTPTFWPHYGSVLVLPLAACVGVTIGWAIRPLPDSLGGRLGAALVATGPAALVLVASWGAYPWSERPLLVTSTPGACLASATPGEQALADAVPERVSDCVSPLDPYGVQTLAEQQGSG